jgi:nitroreductase
VTVVFAADLETTRLMPRLVAMLRRGKTYPEAMLKKVPFYRSVALPSSQYRRLVWTLTKRFGGPCDSLVFSGGYRTGLLRLLMYWAKRAVFALLGLVKAVPRLEAPETWASKNAMLAAQTLMLAATAHGLASCPMEGFDALRVRRALGIPSRYCIPVVIALGYQAASQEEKLPTERYPFEEVFFSDRFGQPCALAAAA